MGPLIPNLNIGWRKVGRFTPRPLYPRGREPDTRWIGGWGLGLILVLWRTELLLRPGIVPQCLSPPDLIVFTILSELSWLPHYCVLHIRLNVLILSCHRTETSNRGAKQWQVSCFTVKICYSFTLWKMKEIFHFDSHMLLTFWMHNISQFLVCFTPILLVSLQLYSWWGAWWSWIIGTCLLKPHGITPPKKGMANVWITLFKNCCKFSCVQHKVSCSELISSYCYSMNNFCDSWRIKDQLDVTCYLFHFLRAQHVSNINISNQEPATILLNYHICRIVL